MLFQVVVDIYSKQVLSMFACEELHAGFHSITKNCHEFLIIRLTLEEVNFRQILPQHVHTLQDARGQLVSGCRSLLSKLFSSKRKFCLASTICFSGSLSNVASMTCCPPLVFRPMHVAILLCQSQRVCRQRCRGESQR